MRRTERASLSVMARSRKSSAASFVRRQKNSASSSRTLCLVGLPRGSLAALGDVLGSGTVPSFSGSGDAGQGGAPCRLEHSPVVA